MEFFEIDMANEFLAENYTNKDTGKGSSGSCTLRGGQVVRYKNQKFMQECNPTLTVKTLGNIKTATFGKAVK